MKTPQLEWHEGPDGEPGFLVRTPYRAEFAEQLKALLPSSDRRWWEGMKAWWVAEGHEDIVRHLILDHFGAVVLLDERGHADIETRGDARLRQEGLF